MARRKPSKVATVPPQPHVCVINESSVLSDDEVQSIVPALQRQVEEHFAPIWGVGARISFTPAGWAPEKGSWWLVVLDHSEQAGAGGYHDLTNDGLPLAKVFAATDLQYKREWTVTASHELLEMLADPHVNLAAAVEPGPQSAMVLYAYDVADPCAPDEFGYRIDGVLVSDFVFPTWFEPLWQQGQVQFDFRNKITRPLELLPGGYIGVYDIASGGGWTQLTAQKGPIGYYSRPHVGSRRERRRTPKSAWQRSRAQHTGIPKRRNGDVRHSRVVFFEQ